jgi:hypothetical protein
MSQEQRIRPTRLSRRAALQAGAALGAAGAALAAGPATDALAAQGGWRSEHLEWDFVPTGSSITLAGSGPPQRGDFFSAFAALTAVGDTGGTQVGTYNCFGVWTSASNDTSVPYTRLTTVQFNLGGGSVFGIINEGQPPGAPDPIGVIHGGTGRYAGAQGTFQQPGGPPPVPVRAVLDLLIPGQG